MTMTAAGVAKAIEECGELQIELGQMTQVLGKMLAWWNTDEPHWDGSNLRERLADEMGDVQAAMQFIVERLGLDRQRIVARTEAKLATFDTWQAEIDNNDHGIDAPTKRSADDIMSDEMIEALLGWRHSLNTVGIPGENQDEDVRHLKNAVDTWKRNRR